MKRFLLFSLALTLLTSMAFAQTGKVWSAYTNSGNIVTDKGVKRISYPKVFKLYELDLASLRAELFKVVSSDGRRAPQQWSTVITLPNTSGEMESFEVVEASNFDPSLQARFPEIRAFSGKSLSNPGSMLKLSYSPQGIQTIVFRSGKVSEIIEPYSADHAIYAVFERQRNGIIPWMCSTPDADLAQDLAAHVSTMRPTANDGKLRTMRLAQSVTAEYSNYFGATSAAQVNLVLAAVNASLTRCNGCYEKDLAIHLNLIPNTTDLFYYNPATDPYSPAATGAGGAWNNEVQATITSVIGEANYDIGHLFGATGGGGSAGCIGCVCGTGKGRGFTSPADAIPQGDNFDIDYVTHEVAHQLGGNHTFSHALEGSGQNKEVGSGITIMGYAGITNWDVANHSIDIYHETSIGQIQTNMAGKTCPVVTDVTANNATPVVAPVANFTIPISTPFALTGSATDANAADALTYCWEQDDNATTSGANSVASATKLTGPNWVTFPAVTTGTRIFPRLQTVLAGNLVTGPGVLTGGAIAIEALSSVSRNLKFRLTVRDNAPYSSNAPVKVAQTAFTDMTVTVTNTSGPFQVTQPNTNVDWPNGSTQTITWAVANTTTAPVSCANVKISLSTDGGLTWPTVLVANTPNDGSETVTITGGPSTTARVKVEAVGNIFFDISNTNFTISGAATPTFNFNSLAPTTVACAAATTVSATLGTTAVSGFATPITLTSTAGVPAGTTVTFGGNPVTPGNSATITLNGVNTLAAGTYNVTITGTAGTEIKTTTVAFVVQPGAGPSFTTQPAAQSICVGANATFTTASTGALSLQWQVSTGGGPFSNITGATSATYTITNATASQNGTSYQLIATGQCGNTTSSSAALTVITGPAFTTQPAATSGCTGGTASFTTAVSGSTATYQWQVGNSATGPWTNVTGGTSATLSLTGLTAAQNNTYYQVIVTNTCGSSTSNSVLLTVNTTAVINTQPVAQNVCSGLSTSFSVAAIGTGLGYQWQVSTDGGATWSDITGATAATYSIASVTSSLNGNRYRVRISSICSATPTVSDAVLLTVFNPVSIVSAPPATQRACVGDDVTFTVNATGSNLSYQWSVSTNGGTTYTNIAGATSSTFVIPSVAIGSNGYLYRVTVTGVPCGLVTTSPTLLIVNYKPGVVLATGNPSGTAITPATTTTLYATVSPAQGNYAYAWTLNNTTLSNTGNSQYVNLDALGTYTVTVTDVATGCFKKSNEVKMTEQISSNVFVYPNPNQGQFQVRYYGPTAQQVTAVRTINIYDAKGARVYSKAYSLNRMYEGMDVDMRNMNSGIYMLELLDASGKRLGSSSVIVK